MAKLYLVERRSWDVNRYEEVPESYNSDDYPHGVPVAAFTALVPAEQWARELTVAARGHTNPFSFEGADLDFLSELPEAAILDRVIELGLIPPPPTERHQRDWITWYDDLASQLTDAQRDGVWDLLDLLVLYAVVPVELEE